MSSPTLRADLHVREIDGEAVILDRQQNQMHSFNATAACILDAVDGSHSPEEISRLLCERFSITEEVALRDTRNLLGQLEELGLLEAVEASRT